MRHRIVRMIGAVLVSAGIALAALAALALESPVGVIAPVEGACWVGAGVAALATWALWRPSRRTSWIVGLAVGAPLVWVLWQGHGRIACADVEASSDGLRIAGTLCWPRGDQAVPGAVIVHGAGPEPRGEYLFYARYLARRGVAAVAYDKRGVGASQGSTYAGGYEEFADDARAMLDVLREWPPVDPSRVGYAGWSEGEWVVAIATRADPPAFAVVVGGSALSPADQVREAIGIRLQRAGFGADAVAEAHRIHDLESAYVRGGPVGPFRQALESASAEPWFRVHTGLPPQVWERAEYGWWGRVMDYSPEPDWQAYSGPLLFVKGSLDDRSDASRLDERLRAMRPEAALTEIVLFAGAGHAMTTWPLGERVPPPAWPDGYPDLLAEWILRVAAGAGHRESAPAGPPAPPP